MNSILRVFFARVISIILQGKNIRANGPDFNRAGRSTITSNAVKPFEIKVDDSVLKDLQERLMRTRLPDQLEAVRWDYGADLSYLKEVIEYWRTEYDWREQERKLNQLDHFKTTIDGLDIHFIHQRSKEKSALPLVITHGWPGSVTEFRKVLGPLTDPVAHGGRARTLFMSFYPRCPATAFPISRAKRASTVITSVRLLPSSWLAWVTPATQHREVTGVPRSPPGWVVRTRSMWLGFI